MDIVSSKPVGLSTVKKILEKRPKEELGYEQQQALEYVKTFCKLDEKTAAKLVEGLSKQSQLTEETLIKLANILPKRSPTLKAILSKDKIELTDEELSHVFELVKKSK